MAEPSPSPVGPGVCQTLPPGNERPRSRDQITGESRAPGRKAGYRSACPPPPCTLRRLGPADVSLLRKLNALFGTVFGDLATYGGQPSTDAYLEDLLGKTSTISP